MSGEAYSAFSTITPKKNIGKIVDAEDVYS
jgi:hypothetical protein